MTDFFASRVNVAAMADEHGALWRALFERCRPYLRPRSRILDFGCSDGHMLELFLRGDGDRWPGADCAFALGIDHPRVAPLLARAAHRLSDLPVGFSVAPASAFPAQFDLIVSHEAVYLLPDLPATFGEMRTALSPGGHVVLTTGCHVENELYADWRRELTNEGVEALPYTIRDYIDGLEAAGFSIVEHGSLRLTTDAYDMWVSTRTDRNPNPAWFPNAEAERSYYTVFGKLLLIARRP